MTFDSVRPLTSLESVIADHDIFLIDQWGVIHEGHSVYPGAREALLRIKKAGKTIVILTNSSKSNKVNVDRLADEFAIGGDCYDHVVSSAHYLLEGLASDPKSVWPGFAVSKPKAHVLADGRDIAIVEEYGLPIAESVAVADYVLLLSVPAGEGIVDQQHWIPEAIGRKLPILSPSADLHSVSLNKGLVNGLESIVSGYAERGGSVVNFGKPSRSIYDVVRKLVGEVRPERVLAIGDQTGSDVRGAKSQGYRSLLVLTGAGRARIGAHGLDDAVKKLNATSFPATERPDYVMEKMAP